MTIKTTLSTLLIFTVGLIAAQPDDFQLDSYKARYERRPAMVLRGQANFDGNYAKNQLGVNRSVISGNLFWQELRNTDALISSWWLSGGLQGRFGQSSGLSQERFNAGSMYTSAWWEQSHYYQENRFWGWGGRLQGNGNASTFSNGTGEVGLRLSPSIFKGRGRIDYAEDALLARWMIEDLQEAGVIGEVTSEDIIALASTITDIIGNRTFDLRRRRIYELRRLHDILLERGIADRESFDLFAILNDNWAFANQQSLPHGKRLTYGLEANSDYNWRDNNQLPPLENPSMFYTYGAAFVEYSSARLRGNGGGQWTARMGGGYYYATRKYKEAEWESYDNGPFAQASLGYTYRWLPTSRTSLRWINEATVTWGLPHELYPFGLLENQARWNSSLILDYFINYQWSFNLRVGGVFIYSEVPDRLSFSPGFNFSTNYYLF